MYTVEREEELKNNVAEDVFWLYDTTQILGDVDFCVSMYQNKGEFKFDYEYLLWAEAKKGKSNIYNSFVQLILTIGKARTFDKHLPPAFIGAFDSFDIAFISYNDVQEVFYQNDFNWNVKPSNHNSKEFKQLHDLVIDTLNNKSLFFNFSDDKKQLKRFIKQNFAASKFGLVKNKVDKNNFVIIYNKWLNSVRPTISVDWKAAKKSGIIDGDFYLADLLSSGNKTLKESLYVLLNNDHYIIDRTIDKSGFFNSKEAEFNDKQIAHTQFWNKYERPPKEEYWDYIIERRDLLVPQDVRERKGSYFTPQVWVELSQEYLNDIFGDDWQEEYYLWDCAAGTGNLLHGITNKYNVWASTLDKQDIDVMNDRIDNGANLLKSHVFKFDFLNDSFDKLPEKLRDIINDPVKRKKLIIYINPPYAEATSSKTVTGTGKNKKGVAKKHAAAAKYKKQIKSAANELFALFMARVYDEIPGSFLAIFSKLKFIQGTNFRSFKSFFRASYLGGFVVPAKSFDNVKGKFPIAFTIWNLRSEQTIQEVTTDVYSIKAEYIGQKSFYGNLPPSINKWIRSYDKVDKSRAIGFMENPAPDLQNNKFLNISVKQGTRHVTYYPFVADNIIPGTVYFSVRESFTTTWLNDRDQFLTPNDNWFRDKEFICDCIIYTLFHTQNRVSVEDGTNHWIPFKEDQVDAKEKFDSNFMYEYIFKKIDFGSLSQTKDLFTNIESGGNIFLWNVENKAVYSAGKKLWTYYHSKDGANPNGSYYDIRSYFQGRNENGRMNNHSDDDEYNQLLAALKASIDELGQKIRVKALYHKFIKKNAHNTAPPSTG